MLSRTSLLLALVALAAPAHWLWSQSDATGSLTQGTAVLEVTFNEEATAKVDGRDLGKGGKATFKDLKPSERRPVKLTVKFAVGKEVEQLVEIESGQHVRLALAASSAMPEMTVSGSVSPVSALATSKDGRFIVIGHDDKSATLWDLKAGRLIRTFKGAGGPISGVAFSPDGRAFAVSSTEGPVIVWETATGKKIRDMSGNKASVHSVQYSPDGSKVLTVAADKTAILWDAASGEKLRAFEGHNDEVTSVAFSFDGKQIATASKDKTTALWNATTGEKIRDFAGDHGAVMKVRFGPDGKTILTVSADKNVHLWDVTTGMELKMYGPHSREVSDAVFSPDGQGIVIAGGDNVCYVYDRESGQKLRTLVGHAEKLTCVEMSAGGRWFVTGSQDGTARMWDLATGAELAALIDGNSGRSWAVVSPSGLFDGDEEGRTLVKYRFQENPEDQIAKYTTDAHGATRRIFHEEGTATFADGFFPTLFHPGLLHDVISGARPLPKEKPGQSIPPTVTILSPKSGNVGARDTLIDIEAVDQGGGVGELALFQNHVRIKPQVEKTESGKVTHYAFNMLMYKGANHLEVRNSSGDGQWETDPVWVDLKYTAPVNRPAELYIVAVGVDDYAGAKSGLKYAAKDAQAIAEAFRTSAGALYEKTHVTVLQNKEATKSAILDRVRKMSEAATTEDTVILYCAGFGTHTAQDYFFLPQEFRLKDGIPVDKSDVLMTFSEFSGILAESPALRRLMIFDTCEFGGTVDDRSQSQLRGAADRSAHTGGIFSILSAADSAKSRESSALSHGFLTYALLAALKAPTEGPLAGQSVPPGSIPQAVDVISLFDFVSERLPALLDPANGRLEFATSTQRYTIPLVSMQK